MISHIVCVSVLRPIDTEGHPSGCGNGDTDTQGRKEAEDGQIRNDSTGNVKVPTVVPIATVTPSTSLQSFNHILDNRFDHEASLRRIPRS